MLAKVASVRETGRSKYIHESEEKGNTLSFSLFFKDDPTPRKLELHYSTSFGLLGYAINDVPGKLSNEVRALWQSLLVSTFNNTYCQFIPKEYKLQPTKKNQDDSAPFARSFWQIKPTRDSAFRSYRAFMPQGTTVKTRYCTLDLEDALSPSP